jgi:hypothetical protein
MIRTEAITASGPCHNRKNIRAPLAISLWLTRFSVHLLLKPRFLVKDRRINKGGLRFLRDSKISAGALPGFDLLPLLLQRGCLSFDALHTSPVACSSSYFFFSLSKPSRKA